ncbi:MAG TPA: hypothetical protein DEB39_15055, partial [Planctomycetaceae bacterium]|nr:hypothetical protein [Planctomycetaceae bacterium]
HRRADGSAARHGVDAPTTGHRNHHHYQCSLRNVNPFRNVNPPRLSTNTTAHAAYTFQGFYPIRPIRLAVPARRMVEIR